MTWNTGAQVNSFESLFYSMGITIMWFDSFYETFFVFSILGKKSVNNPVPNKPKRSKKWKKCFMSYAIDTIRCSQCLWNSQKTWRSLEQACLLKSLADSMSSCILVIIRLKCSEVDLCYDLNSLITFELTFVEVLLIKIPM